MPGLWLRCDVGGQNKAAVTAVLVVLGSSQLYVSGTTTAGDGTLHHHQAVIFFFIIIFIFLSLIIIILVVIFTIIIMEPGVLVRVIKVTIDINCDGHEDSIVVVLEVMQQLIMLIFGSQS